MTQLLVGQAVAEAEACVKVASRRYVRLEAWNALRPYEREYLRCYAAGSSAHRSVLVSRSAARLLNMWTIPDGKEVIELAQTHGTPPSTKDWPDGLRYRHMRIPESDVYCIHRTDCIGADRKIQVTSPERTAIDIARFHGVRQGTVAMDWLLSFGTLQEKRRRWETIQAKIARLKGKRGIANARRALELASPWSESPYETLLRVILHENGIEVEMQLWIGPDFRVDLIWGNLVIEIDGLDKFENKPHDAVLSQLKRETWIREQGYEVIRFFTREILRNPEECLRRIREAKARADKRGEPQVAATQQRPRQRQSRFP
ncbi:endonuclease domain-containing protein [Corynebacterium coyleae]|uniref:endonuclease domain-containing protein n=1 Tax=Corynebacterium coyleae TaxID=53374 RepID=UPI001CCF03E4|nr:DUF559 domain-containing protein [Corynebacterium coyleae]UBI09205.1 endonuclease domain-containing protein [Corynebacterium coyleae]